MLFGISDNSTQKEATAKFEETKDNDAGNADLLMDMLGVTLEDDAAKMETGGAIDDAIVIEDDAIIVEGNDKKKPAGKASKPLTEDDKAILNADKQSRPLWMEQERTKYDSNSILKAYIPQKDIDFELFDKDYISVIEVFSMQNQVPFNMEEELVSQIDVKRFQEKPGGANANKRYLASKAGPAAHKGGKSDWTKHRPGGRDGGLDDDDDEADPEWVEFDPEKDKTKFFGHVMPDEQKMRDNIVKKKEREVAKAEKRKRDFIEMAINEGMTEE